MDWTDVDTVYTPDARTGVIGPWGARMGEALQLIRESRARGVGFFAAPALRLRAAPLRREPEEAYQEYQKIWEQLRRDPLLRIAVWVTLIAVTRISIDDKDEVAVWDYATRRWERARNLKETCTHEHLFKVGDGEEVLCPVCAGEDPPADSEAIKRSEVFVS